MLLDVPGCSVLVIVIHSVFIILSLTLLCLNKKESNLNQANGGSNVQKKQDAASKLDSSANSNKSVQFECDPDLASVYRPIPTRPAPKKAALVAGSVENTADEANRVGRTEENNEVTNLQSICTVEHPTKKSEAESNKGNKTESNKGNRMEEDTQQDVVSEKSNLVKTDRKNAEDIKDKLTSKEKEVGKKDELDPTIPDQKEESTQRDVTNKKPILLQTNEKVSENAISKEKRTMEKDKVDSTEPDQEDKSSKKGAKSKNPNILNTDRTSSESTKRETSINGKVIRASDSKRHNFSAKTQSSSTLSRSRRGPKIDHPSHKEEKTQDFEKSRKSSERSNRTKKEESKSSERVEGKSEERNDSKKNPEKAEQPSSDSESSGKTVKPAPPTDQTQMMPPSKLDSSTQDQKPSLQSQELPDRTQVLPVNKPDFPSQNEVPPPPEETPERNQMPSPAKPSSPSQIRNLQRNGSRIIPCSTYF